MTYDMLILFIQNCPVRNGIQYIKQGSLLSDFVLLLLHLSLHSEILKNILLLLEDKEMVGIR